MLWPLKFIFVPIFTSNGFQRERERERERVGERERKKREPRSRIRHCQRTPSSSSTIVRTRSHRSCQSHRAARFCLRSCLRSISPLRDLAFDPPIFDPPIFNPPISLCDFDFYCCCGGVVVVFWWLWLPKFAAVGLHWSFGGVWCWYLAVICSVDWDLAVILKFSIIKFVWMLRK